MAEFLGIGISHYPPFSGKDDAMANIFFHRLNDPGIPEDAKDPKNWPQFLRDELSDDNGVAAAARHRQQMQDGMTRCMTALREFDPDFCIIFGDDQYENFREDIVPPYCVLAYEDMVVRPWQQAQGSSDMVGKPNQWNEPFDYELPIKFATQEARNLVTNLIRAEFDMPYAYQPLHHPGISHSILNAILYLDWERKGWDWPIIPCTVNCYGEKVISHKGFVTNINDVRLPDPPGPTPKRCFDLGAAIVKSFANTSHKIAIIGSSSWSHAFLTDKTYRMMPDVEFDKKMYAALKAGDYEYWKEQSPEALDDSGNAEMLNWMALIGAMQAADMKPQWTDFVETLLFNSSKVAAIFK